MKAFNEVSWSDRFEMTDCAQASPVVLERGLEMRVTREFGAGDGTMSEGSYLCTMVLTADISHGFCYI